MIKQWEYRVTTGDLGVIDLGEIGKDGWELCGAVQSASYFVTLYFKREIQSEKRIATLIEKSTNMDMTIDEQKDNLIKVKPRKKEGNENKDTGYRK